MRQDNQGGSDYGMINFSGKASEASSPSQTPSQNQVEDALFESPSVIQQTSSSDDEWLPIAPDTKESVASMLRQLPELDLDAEVSSARKPFGSTLPAAPRETLPTVEPVRIHKVTEAARQAASRRNLSGRPKAGMTETPADVLGRLGRRRRAPFFVPLLVLTSGIGAAAAFLAFAKSVPFAIVLALLGVVGSLLCRALLKD